MTAATVKGNGIVLAVKAARETRRDLWVPAGVFIVTVALGRGVGGGEGGEKSKTWSPCLSPPSSGTMDNEANVG